MLVGSSCCGDCSRGWIWEIAQKYCLKADAVTYILCWWSVNHWTDYLMMPLCTLFRRWQDPTVDLLIVLNQWRTASISVNATEFKFYLFAWIIGYVTYVVPSDRSYRSDHVSLNVWLCWRNAQRCGVDCWSLSELNWVQPNCWIVHRFKVVAKSQTLEQDEEVDNV